MTSPHFTRHIRSDPNELEHLVPELAAFLEQRNVEASVNYVVQLAVEELLLNVMNHGYRGDRTRAIDLRIDAVANEATIEVEDDAEPFDLRAAPEPDFDDILNGTRVGGLGVHLVRSLSASVDYERIDNRNRVRVRVVPLPMPRS